MSIYIWIIIVLLLSAFFSASEIAFISADRLRIEIDKSRENWYSNIQAVFFSNPGHFITTMLIGNNIALVVYGLLMAKLLEPDIARIISSPLGVVLVQTIISTIIILIFAEFIPKAVSKLNPNWQIKFFALPLFLLYILIYPIAIFASWLSRILFKIFRISDNAEGGIQLGKVDLDKYIEFNTPNSKEETSSKGADVKILQNALEFVDIKVRDCFVPRNEVIACDETTTKRELIKMFDDSGYSKILVYKESIDNIVGYIHATEMFVCGEEWQKHVKPTIYVPESIAAKKVMHLLMQKKKSIAIVVDELGGTAGIVTLEDLVEEIFGNIEDEHDNKSIFSKQVDEHEYLFSGRAEIDDLNDEFGINLPTSDEYKTIAGMILHFHQSFPRRGEEIEIPPCFHVKVVRATNNKITLIRLKVHEEI